MSDTLQIDVVVSAPFMQNTQIVHRPGRTDCVVVDPGFEPDKIVRQLQARNVRPAAFLVTHGHVDHIAGNATLKQLFPEAPLIIGKGDARMLTDPLANLSVLGDGEVISPPADRLVSEGDVVEAAGIEFKVFDIPGHSPGHVVYLVSSESPQVVLGGDVLFAGSIGRCDFPGGNQGLLVRGIRSKLFTLPDETIVYTGHGPTTTVGQERRSNPFCGE